MPELLYRRLHPDLPAFGPAKPGDAGIDLHNAGGPIRVEPGCSVQVPAGVAVKVPEGWVGFIKSRSSTFFKRGLFVIEGVIDSGYTGPLYSFVWNPGLNGRREAIEIQPWERLSQLVVVPHLPYHGDADEGEGICRVEQLPDTVRGGTGFGSTGY